MKHPLMENNIETSHVDELISFLKSTDRFTNGTKVREFERQWSKWLGVKYSVFVNSGSSANILTMETLKHLEDSDRDEVIVPPLTWISDVASVIRAGFRPVFVDIDSSTLALDEKKLKAAITEKTRAIFLTHILGFNGLSEGILELCREKGIHLVEDCCESHGASFKGRKIGNFGVMSNFSFYFAHHMSTIEGGMISTNDENAYNILRMLRSHGMLRESDDADFIDRKVKEHPEVHKEFIFPVMGYNFRSTELNAVLGLAQLSGLDDNVKKRNENALRFYDKLSDAYWKDFQFDGFSNYSFVVVMKKKDKQAFAKLCERLRDGGVEFRRGLSGGGNQLRQPYLRDLVDWKPEDFETVEHVHEFGMYIGNYPSLDAERIDALVDILNGVAICSK